MESKSTLLQKECENENLPFLGIEKKIPNFYDTLSIIINKQPHEQKPVLYGVIITKTNFNPSIKNYSLLNYYIDETADGKKCFKLIDQNNSFKTIVFDNNLSIEECIQISPDTEDSVVVISRDEKYTKVFYKGTISILEGRNWVKTNSIETVLTKIENAVNFYKKNDLKRLLDFVFYKLSINKIGAVIVYHFSNSLNPQNYTKGEKLQNPINMNSDYELEILKNLLDNNDGAVILDNDFSIKYKKVFLHYEKETQSKVRPYPGTRRTSSACYSYENHDVLIFTISDDGPVTIFYKGHIIEEIAFIENRKKREQAEKFFEFVEGLANSDNENYSYDCTTTQAICPKCGKRYTLYISKLSGWNDREDAYCKCGEKLGTYHCYNIDEVQNI